MELTANGNMFYTIVKLFGTWILRKRLAKWTFEFHHNNMESRPYTYCVGVIPPCKNVVGRIACTFSIYSYVIQASSTRAFIYNVDFFHNSIMVLEFKKKHKSLSGGD